MTEERWQELGNLSIEYDVPMEHILATVEEFGDEDMVGLIEQLEDEARMKGEDEPEEFLLAEVQVSYQRYAPITSERITNPDKAADIMRQLFGINLNLREELYMIAVNRANNVAGWYRLSQGGVAMCAVDVRLLAAVALKTLASGVIIAHNHPSGNVQPSGEDIKVAKKIKSALKLLDIGLLDSMVITENDYYSMASRGDL